MVDTLDNIKPENITAALKGFYTPPKPTGRLVEGKGLIELLRQLPSLATEDNVDPVHVQIQKHHRGVSFQPEDHALIAFVDDAITQVLRQTDLDFKIEAYVRALGPYIAIIAIEQGARAITRRQPILTLIDTLMTNCVGWSEDLGILGDQFMDKIEDPMRMLIKDRSTIEECQGVLNTLFAKETPIWEKMERRLCDSELGELMGLKGRYYAAELLNQNMSNKPLPLFIIFMLQGSWYEFLQAVFVTYGQRSPEWKRASKITERLVWSLQAQDDIAKHEEVMSALPAQVQDFCSQLSFDTAPFESCMADVEGEYENIRAGTPSDPCDFELLETDASVAGFDSEVDRRMLRQIEQYKEGQWFLYDDKEESKEKVARIRLILNWRDTERLLFTNHNRRKALHMTYSELAGFLETKTVRPLNPRAGSHEVIRTHLLIAIQGIQQQKKREIEIEEVTERKQVSQEYLAKRKASLVKALEQHKRLAAEKQERARILREKADRKRQAAEEAVRALKVEAWVKLPLMEGTLTPCRLVAIIPGNDKYIFANRAGIKVAEFTGSQLAGMIITENSEILDTGAEFENVLASVVTGLREDRNKSYDELTGDTA